MALDWNNLGSLVPDYQKYKTTNPYGLEDYTPEDFGYVDVGGKRMRLLPFGDSGGTGFQLIDPANEKAGGNVYNPDGTFRNHTVYNAGNDWGNFGMFLASALTMGGSEFLNAGALAADSGAGAGAGAASAIGAGDATAAGYAGLDAASTATLGGGASGAYGGGLAGLGAVGGTGAMGAGGSAAPAFNAAADSQLANVGIDAAGGNALGGYSAAGLSPAAEAGGSSNYLSSLGKALGINSSGDLAGAALKYGAPLLGSAISANAAGKAADTQAAATDRANAMLQGNLDRTRADLAPWRDSGIKANNALVSAMGLGPNDGTAGYGSLTKPFTGADLQNEPGYQFGLTQGQRAIDGKAAAGGSYFSGNALKAAARYGQDYAGTKYGEAFNRDASTKGQQYGFLSGMSTQGQNAANMTGQFGASATGQIAGNTTAQGNASGAAQIAQGNALSNALGSVTNAYTQDNMLQQLLASQERQRMITGGNTNGLR